VVDDLDDDVHLNDVEVDVVVKKPRLRGCPKKLNPNGFSFFLV
jgi:hypothetical protein